MKKTWVFAFALVGLITWAGAAQAEDMQPVAQEEPAETAAPAIEAGQAVEAMPAARPTSAEETMPTAAPEPQVEEAPAEEKPTMDAVETEVPAAEQVEPVADTYMEHLKECSPYEASSDHPEFKDTKVTTVIHGRFGGDCLMDVWFAVPDSGSKIHDVRCFYDDMALLDITSGTSETVQADAKARSCKEYLDGVLQEEAAVVEAPVEPETMPDVASEEEKPEDAVEPQAEHTEPSAP